MGSLPQIFTGDRTKATEFIEEVKGYIQLNQDVPGFNSPIKKAALTLTLIKGPEVTGWVRNMGHWIDQLNPTLDNVPFVWEQFLREFARQFHDSQQEERARIKLENLRMTFPDIDGYISQFEDLARQAGYTRGNPETMQLFLSRLDRSTLEGVLRPPFTHGYQAIKERAIESTWSTQLVHSIIGQPKKQHNPRLKLSQKPTLVSLVSLVNKKDTSHTIALQEENRPPSSTWKKNPPHPLTPLKMSAPD